MKKITQWRIYICSRQNSEKERATIRFAAEELKKYLRKMNPSYLTDLIPVKEGMELSNNGIWLGLAEEWKSLLPEVANPELDDAILIDVQDGKGMITGTNARSVLIAVYRYLRELGCAFVRPGPDGEIIPACDPVEKNVYVKEAASYRHRGCELPFSHQQFTLEALDWLPKVGMNAYFPEGGFRSHSALKSWYSGNNYANNGNELREHVATTEAEGESMQEVVEEELARRGLFYHCVGHGWTNIDAFHVNDLHNWVRNETKACPEYAQYIAMVNGKREVLRNYAPSDTNLCYSMPYVRDSMTDAVVEYCKTHPQADYVHFWLADGTNNHCECENCVVQRPSDWYIQMLNELDEKMTAANLTNRIVMLIYVDLMWEPRKQVLKNPDRFTLMFAPITRVYSSSFALDKTVDMDAVDAALPDYVRNHLQMPRTVADNIAYLRRWQKQIPTDSFDFDYHGFWAHFADPVGFRISRIMYEDMHGLKDIGINGMVHCQIIRNWMPTGLMNNVMAATLWNRELDYEAFVQQYYRECFGAEGDAVLAFLQKAHALTPTPDMGTGRPEGDPKEQAARLRSVRSLCQEFLPFVEKCLADTVLEEAHQLSWTYLHYFVERFLPLTAEYYAALYLEEKELARKIYGELVEMIKRMEDVYPACSDVAILMSTLQIFLEDFNAKE